MTSNQSVKQVETCDQHSQQPRQILWPIPAPQERYSCHDIRTENLKRCVTCDDDWSRSSQSGPGKEGDKVFENGRKNGPIKGTCEDMCPAKEAHLRRTNKLVDKLEMGQESGVNTPNPRRMVKKFLNSTFKVDGMDSHDVRTPSTLLATTKYLITRIADDPEVDFSRSYEFICDRLRGVRQDLMIQDIHDETRIQILEYCTTFHLYASYELHNCPPQVYDDHLNGKFLRECFGQLLSSYAELKVITCRRILMESAFLLMDFGSAEALDRYRYLPNSVRKNKTYQLCQRLNFLAFSGNYHCILHSLENLHSLLKIAMNLRLPTVMELYFRALCHGFNSSGGKFPLEKLVEILIPYNKDRDNSLEWIKEAVINTRAEIDEEHLRFQKNNYTSDHKIPRRKWKSIDDEIVEPKIMGLLWVN
ncbi:SAC3 domain-containing protein 1 [Brevipalpus obovatus]|uniref:SAC3 domain-containing protein 1 n=1 Tax=Brevipalpus obovatus TaxID=246614 RepID=UPI003D9F6451